MPAPPEESSVEHRAAGPRRLSVLLDEHASLERELADPAVHADQSRARRLSRRYAQLAPLVETARALEEARGNLATARELAGEDASFAAEAGTLEAQVEELTGRLREQLLPKDPDDDKDVILEIKAGEGGAESALFAGDLLRMYLRYAERRGWSTEILDAVDAELGGYKDVAVAIKSPDRRGHLVPAEVRGRRAPRAAGAGHREPGPHPHVRGRRPGAAGGRGGRRHRRPERPADRRLPVLGARRAEREHHRLRRPDHPPAQRHRGQLAEREEPAAEPGVRAARPPVAAARRRPRGGGGHRQRPAAQPGAHDGPQRAGAHLQLPGEPDRRPPGRLQGAQPRPGRSTATSTRSSTPCMAAHTAELLAAGS